MCSQITSIIIFVLQTEFIEFWECFDVWRQRKCSRWIKKRGKYVVHKRICKCLISSPWHCYIKIDCESFCLLSMKPIEIKGSKKNDNSFCSFHDQPHSLSLLTSRIFFDATTKQQYVVIYSITSHQLIIKNSFSLHACDTQKRILFQEL